MKGKVNLFSRLERVREGVSSKGLDGCDLDGALYLDLGSGAMGTKNLKMVAGTMMPIELGYVTREYEEPVIDGALGYCKVPDGLNTYHILIQVKARTELDFGRKSELRVHHVRLKAVLCYLVRFPHISVKKQYTQRGDIVIAIGSILGQAICWAVRYCRQ
jgi:hypothetical protein